jgi:acetyltransferase-like isoleucine patch superfamily enzyme
VNRSAPDPAAGADAGAAGGAGTDAAAARVAVAPYRPARELLSGGRFATVRRYQELVVGSPRLRDLLAFELATGLLSSLSGAAGLFLRRLVYRALLGSVGAGGPMIGRWVVLRQPVRIHLGARVVIEDGCALDARSPEPRGIVLGDEVILSRGVVLACKDGAISIGERTGLGAYTVVQSVGTSRVTIGPDCAIAPHVYVVGGSHYRTDRLDLPIAAQGLELRGGVRIGAGCWIGGHVTILDGVEIGERAIVGAGAVVTRDVPAFGVAVGVPARVVADRRET